MSSATDSIPIAHCEKEMEDTYLATAQATLQTTHGNPKGHSKNRSLDLRETVMVGNMEKQQANSVFKMQRQLFARSERVKGIDFHPVEPWILTTLYSGMCLCQGKGADGNCANGCARSCLYMVV